MVNLFLTSLIFFVVLYNLSKINFKTVRKNKKLLALAKNSKTVATVKNDISDFQKIKTSEITLPVIKATVLEYQPYELGEDFPEVTKLYYSPEAIAEKDFLESIKRSPLQVETHEKNTGEFNLDVNGWSVESWYDSNDKTTYAKGFLIGSENIDYAKKNLNKETFGTSAFISFLEIEKEKGKTPEGLEYDAIAKKTICNHVAILPNIRDNNNKIVSINAKNAKIETTTAKNKTEKNTMPEAMTQEEFNAKMQVWEETQKAKNEQEAKASEKLVNSVLEKLQNSKNEEEPKKEEAPATNEDEPKKEETSTNEEETLKNEDSSEVANALPNQKLVSDFSDFYSIEFKKTPTVKELAKIAGIEYKNFGQALNAIKEKIQSVATVKNSKTNLDNSEKSIVEILKEI